MGICGGKSLSSEEIASRKEEKARSREVDTTIADDHQADNQVNKLLLLGAGGSGKSTLFKQMITIYGHGFPESDRRNFTPIIYNNVIVSMKTLCEQSANFNDKNCEVGEENLQSKRFIEELKEDDDITEEAGRHITILWRDAGIQNTYDKRSRYQLTDSASYFFDRINEIMQPMYVPTEQDVLRSRVPTTGIVENHFEIDGNTFKMFDVGGQRSERKKWIHCFENVTAVLFVAAISAYDQVLYEDETTNRMAEALDLFEEITNSEWFEKTSMILFLNKRDLFAEKIKKVSLKDYFPEYQGENNYDDGTDYIQRLFESKNCQEKDVYTHITCATDTNNVFAVFNSVKDIIIKKGLTQAGLM
jgi:guanine nucleotide-binding protein G(i) subunit alpha